MSLFPKVLWPFDYLTLTQNKPSQFFECYLLFDLYCLTMMNEDLPRGNAPRKAVKACPGKDWGSRSESGCAVPFSPQDFCSRVNLFVAAPTHRPHWSESASGRGFVDCRMKRGNNRWLENGDTGIDSLYHLSVE